MIKHTLNTIQLTQEAQATTTTLKFTIRIIKHPIYLYLFTTEILQRTSGRV